MTNGSNSSVHKLTQFHVCVHCGGAYRREEFTGRAITSGVYHCSKCGLDGPLNIQIREVEESAANTDKPSDAGSSS